MNRKTKLVHGVLTAAATAAVAIAQLGCDSTPARAEPPPPKVTVANPETRTVPDYDPYNGWLKSVETVDVRARVRGHLQKVHFKDGDLVTKDQPLFDLDPRPMQTEIDRASDQVRIFESQYAAAAKEEARLKELVTKGGASQRQVDAAEAQTKSLESQIEANKQEVKRKSLDLEYAKITAPIAGRIGKALITEGNLVNAGGSDPVMATIVSVDPIHVYFDVDERALQRYAKTRAAAGATRPAAIRELKLPFSFGLETDDGYPHSAVIDFADNKVESQTGTIQVRGIVPNPGATFIPGSRVRIRVAIGEAKPSLLVPDTAILADQNKRYVLVLDEKNVVRRRDVELCKLLDDGSRVILEPRSVEGAAKPPALTPADRIITQGIQTARLNYPVEPIPAPARPAAPAAPPATAPTTNAAGAPAGQ